MKKTISLLLLFLPFAVYCETIKYSGAGTIQSGDTTFNGSLDVSSLTVNNQTTLKSSVTVLGDMNVSSVSFTTGGETFRLTDGFNASQNSLYFKASNPRMVFENSTPKQWVIEIPADDFEIEEVGIANCRMKILAGGNLGIDTCSPGGKLDVQGSAAFGSGATQSTFSSTGNLQLVAGSTITGNGSIALSSAPTAGTASNIGLAVSTMGAVYLGSRINAPLALHTAGARVSGLAGNGGGTMFSVTDNAGTSKFDIDSCSGIGVCLNTPASATMAMRIGGTTIAQFDTAGGRPFVALSQTDCNLQTPTQRGSLCVENSATCPISVSTGTGAGQWACISISATQGP